MGEFLKRRFADAAGCSYEDGDEVGGEGAGDEGIGGLDYGEGNHVRLLNGSKACLFARKEEQIFISSKGGF